MVGTWWHWVSIEQYRLILYAFIYSKSGDLVRCHRSLTDRETLKDRATQLLRSKGGALVTRLMIDRIIWLSRLVISKVSQRVSQNDYTKTILTVTQCLYFKIIHNVSRLPFQSRNGENKTANSEKFAWFWCLRKVGVKTVHFSCRSNQAL